MKNLSPITDAKDIITKEYLESGLNGKVDKETGKGLSTNDFTTAEKTKLAGLSNYDDTALSNRVSTIEGKEAGWDAKADVSDIPTQLSQLTDDSTHRLVTDSEKSIWGAKLSDAPSDGSDYVRNNGQWKRFEGGGNAEIIQGNFVEVPAASWVADNTYTDFPFKADISIPGITEDWYPMISYAYADAVGGNYCIDVVSDTNKITIWCATVPEDNLMIESIVCSHRPNYVIPLTYKVTGVFQGSYFTKKGCTISGAKRVMPGQSVTLTINIPGDSGVTFKNWSVNGVSVGTNTSYTFTPSADTVVTAVCAGSVAFTVSTAGNSSRCYVRENDTSGTMHYAATPFTMDSDKALYCYAKAYSSSYSSYIIINDETVASHSKSTTASTYTAQIANLVDFNADELKVNIAFDYSTSKDAKVTITSAS